MAPRPRPVQRKTKQAERRRSAHEVERRRSAEEVDAKETQRLQAIAAAQRDLAAAQRRHRRAYALWVLAVILAVTHLFEHTNSIRLMSSGLEDLLIGWPMAIVLGIAGGIVYGT